MIPHRFPIPLGEAIACLCRQEFSSDVFSCVLTLSGRIDESRLQRAVRLAMEAEPILGCRLVQGKFAMCWERRSDLDSLRLCEVLPTNDSAAGLGAFLGEPIEPTDDPLVKVKVFRGTTDTVCLKSTHLVADGPSFAKLAFLVTGIYRRLRADPDYVPEPNLAGTRNLKQAVKELGRGRRLECLRAAMTRSAPADTWVFPTPDRRHGFRGHVLLTFPPDRVRAISRYGRQHRVTITCVFLAAAYLAACDVLKPLGDVATFCTTADLRRFQKGPGRETAMSNMSIPCRFHFDPRVPADFDEVLASIRAELKRFFGNPIVDSRLLSLFMAVPALGHVLRRTPLPLLARPLRRYIRRLKASPKRRWFFVNGGAFDPGAIEVEDAPVEDLYFTGPIYYGPGIGLGTSTFRERITLSMGVSDDVMDESVAVRLLQQVDRWLPFFSEWPATSVTLRG